MLSGVVSFPWSLDPGLRPLISLKRYPHNCVKAGLISTIRPFASVLTRAGSESMRARTFLSKDFSLEASLQREFSVKSAIMFVDLYDSFSFGDAF